MGVNEHISRAKIQWEAPYRKREASHLLTYLDFQLPMFPLICQIAVISLNTMQASLLPQAHCHGLHSQPSDGTVLATVPTRAFIGSLSIGSGTIPPTKGGSLPAIEALIPGSSHFAFSATLAKLRAHFSPLKP